MPTFENKAWQLICSDVTQHLLQQQDKIIYLKLINSKNSILIGMNVLNFFSKKKVEQIQAVQFIPTININPNSTLYLQCSPNDPHTASNIVINSYPSKTDRTNLQTRIQWRRFKVVTDTQHTNTHLPFITGNAYRCQPADLGYYIQAKIISYDDTCSGSGEVTIGPIRLDPTVKQLIEGALYSRSLRSQIKVLEKLLVRNVDMVLNDRTIKLTDEVSSSLLEMGYDISQPKIQVNPKDSTKIYLRFERDEINKVRQWLDVLFEKDNNFEKEIKKSVTQSDGSGSKGKILKSNNLQNKIEIQFLTRHSRDLFIFTLKSFLCKENMKNTQIISIIENVTEIKNPVDSHKFFQYMSLKNQIYRLASLARQLEIDRDMKLKDLQEVQETIAETTTAYMQLLEKKACQLNIDFNQSYSEISIRRDELLGKKQLRELQAENEALKLRVRELLEQIDLKNFFTNKNNESQMLNQTSNPFIKKNNNDSYYNPIMANQVEEQPPNKSIIELTKSYVNLVKQNQKLKEEKKLYSNTKNLSNNSMSYLLESLHEQDEDPAMIIKKLKTQNKTLKAKIQQMSNQNTKKNKNCSSLKLSQSIAYQQQQQQQQITNEKKQKSILVNQESMLVDQSRQEGNSFYSATPFNINQSMTSQAGLMLLESKMKQIQALNKKMSLENDRLRKQRNQYKSQYQQLKKGVNSSSNAMTHKSAISTSNVFDCQNLKLQIQTLTNEKNSLHRRIESLTRETMKGDNLYQRKCQQLTKQNNFLHQQNEQMKKKLETLTALLQVKGSENLGENYKENDKLKKINCQLLEQIKNLKLQIERRADPLNNSRVRELTNQVNALKKTGLGNQTIEEVSQQLLSQISILQKEVEMLRIDNKDKDAKLISQASLIERLMSSQESDSQSLAGKDKSYSETRNDSESNEKLKKKIKQLQEQILMVRRSADALNRSQDMSRQMISYNEQQIQIMRRQKEMILAQNEKLSRMCERYSKDAREANKQLNKWKQQVFDLMKAQHQDSQPIS